jgi:hypothetical protein
MSQKEQEHQEHQFTVGGHKFALSRKQAMTKLATLKAGDIEEVRKYYVANRGRKVPIMQALTTVEPNILRSGSKSTDGIRVFKRLRFKVGQM